ncbi:hypothetical protein ACTXT7_016923, partial [Hymenolepis weldensis]
MQGNKKAWQSLKGWEMGPTWEMGFVRNQQATELAVSCNGTKAYFKSRGRNEVSFFLESKLAKFYEEGMRKLVGRWEDDISSSHVRHSELSYGYQLPLLSLESLKGKTNDLLKDSQTFIQHLPTRAVYPCVSSEAFGVMAELGLQNFRILWRSEITCVQKNLRWIRFWFKNYTAIMLLLLNIYDECFEVNVYEKLGDFMDLMTLICNGGNFVLYCALSSKFRETFVLLFCSLLRL